jgi:hypothetical protein
MGIASGSSSFTFGSDWVSPLDSLARMFCVCTGEAGSGIVLTRVALMAPPPPPPPPHASPRIPMIAP